MSLLRRYRLRLVLAALLLGVAAFNVVAYFHARAMTTFVDGGTASARPEDLSLLEKVDVLLTGVDLVRGPNERDPSDEGLEFERVLLESSDGLDLEAWHVPHPQPVGTVAVFHGYMGRKEHMLREAKALHDAGWSTFLTDFRGNGGSAGRVTTLGWLEALDVVAAVTSARERHRELHRERHEEELPFVVYGQSMGAAAVLHAMAEHGVAADALVLESPFHSLLATVEKRFELLGLPSFPSASLLVFWGGVQHGFDAFDVEPERWAAAFTPPPTLVIHGDLDTRVLTDEARRVVEALGPGTKFHVIDDCGHAPLLRENAEAWNAAVLPFLNGIRADSGPL